MGFKKLLDCVHTQTDTQQPFAYSINLNKKNKKWEITTPFRTVMFTQLERVQLLTGGWLQFLFVQQPHL